MATVFVSYRRSDSSASTGRIADRLQLHFGNDSIFYDVDTIPLGIDFKEYLNERLDRCDIFLAIIGDDWVDAANPDGSRRLEDPSDNVRLEVGTALKRQNIPVVPVLVGSAGVPTSDELPRDLKPLADRNGITVKSDADFDGQVGRLISAIEQRLAMGTDTAAALDQPLRDTVIMPKRKAATPAAETPTASQAAPPPADSAPAKKLNSSRAVIAAVVAVVIAALVVWRPWVTVQDGISGLQQGTTVSDLQAFASCSGVDCSSPMTSTDVGSRVYVRFRYTQETARAETLRLTAMVGDNSQRDRTVEISSGSPASSRLVDYFTVRTAGTMTISVFNDNGDLVGSNTLTVR